MQQTAESAPVSTASSFAGLLAALATSKSERAWDDELADDVATLSYERALRTHARYKPANPATGPLDQSGRFDQSGHFDQSLPFDQPAAPQPEQSQDSFIRFNAQAKREQAAETEVVRDRADSDSAASNGSLKTASITIRMSQAECAQLRQRAAEAGLTISAYLRSCTFEAELLRSQVKEALVQLRSAQVPASAPAPGAPPRASRSWWSRFVPHASMSTARA